MAVENFNKPADPKLLKLIEQSDCRIQTPQGIATLATVNGALCILDKQSLSYVPLDTYPGYTPDEQARLRKDYEKFTKNTGSSNEFAKL